MLKNSKGFELERRISKSHQRSGKMALLVSPLILRERGLGQIDYAEFEPKKDQQEARAVIIECKYTRRPGGLALKQWTRLKNSAGFLGELLDCVVELRIESAK